MWGIGEVVRRRVELLLVESYQGFFYDILQAVEREWYSNGFMQEVGNIELAFRFIYVF